MAPLLNILKMLFCPWRGSCRGRHSEKSRFGRWKEDLRYHISHSRIFFIQNPRKTHSSSLLVSQCCLRWEKQPQGKGGVSPNVRRYIPRTQSQRPSAPRWRSRNDGFGARHVPTAHLPSINLPGLSLISHVGNPYVSREMYKNNVYR